MLINKICDFISFSDRNFAYWMAIHVTFRKQLNVKIKVSDFSALEYNENISFF